MSQNRLGRALRLTVEPAMVIWHPAMAVEPLAMGAQKDRPGQTFADGQVDRAAREPMARPRRGILTSRLWMAEGACLGMEADMFYPGLADPATLRQAKRVSAPCPVATECLDCALTNQARGVWGGTSERERARLAGLPEAS